MGILKNKNQFNQITMTKTKKCCVGGCDKIATKWDGFLIKSRDKVKAGFCEKHWMITICPNIFNKKDCFGIYHKGLEEIIIDKQS